MLAATVLCTLASLTGVDLAPIRYTLRFPQPHTHYVEVAAVVPTDGQSQVEVMMAVWTPGSYLVREYARHVEGLRATSKAGALRTRKVRKNRWRISTGEAEEIIVHYRVYCHEMSVRTNWVEEDFAVLNGAPTFLARADSLRRPHDVLIELPKSWSRSLTGLPRHPERPGPHNYRAPDYDTLVDCPIVCGNPAVHEFEVAGKKHYLVNQGEGDIWDGPKSAIDVKKVVEAHHDLWKVLPYDEYYFLNLIVESGGGLEHKNSTLMMTSRWRSRVPKDYRSWLGLVSHEYFHTWNVKRLRPVELGPFDYENEVHTESLWIAEGITSYYDDLLIHRAGLSKRKAYLEQLSRQIGSLQTTPGRLVHPLEMASYDAWIKHYRRDENTSNTTISYYTKGAVVAFLLDARIRVASEGTRSLDDVMRGAYAAYSAERGFTPEEFRRVASEVAGVDLTEWFRVTVSSTEELDYTEALDWFGLAFKDPDAKKEEKSDPDPQAKDAADDDDDDDEEKPEKGWIGLRTRTEGGRLLVSQVRRETPAHRFGLNVGDEIIAVDGYRVRPEQWDRRREQYRPGDQVTLLISRRDRILEKPITFEKEPPKRWQLEVRKDASDDQKKRLTRWLGR